MALAVCGAGVLPLHSGLGLRRSGEREECGAGLGRGVRPADSCAMPWPEVSWHRRRLVGALGAVFSFFPDWLENRRGTKLRPRAGRRQRRRVCKHCPQKSKKAVKKKKKKRLGNQTEPETGGILKEKGIRSEGRWAVFL